MADSSVAVLALPAIYRELEVDLGDLHWVLTTFNLVLALVPTPAARVTRRAGAVRRFVGGIALFALPMRLWMRHTGRLTRRSWRFGRSFRRCVVGGRLSWRDSKPPSLCSPLVAGGEPALTTEPRVDVRVAHCVT